MVGWCTAEIFAEIEWLDGAPPRYSTRLSLRQFGAVLATPEILAEMITEIRMASRLMAVIHGDKWSTGWSIPSHTHTHVSIHAVLSLVRFPTRVYASRGCKYERAAFESISAWCQMDDVVSVVCRVAYRLKRTELVRKTASSSSESLHLVRGDISNPI